MDNLYLYAITDGPDLEPPMLAGVDGEGVIGWRCGDLLAIVSPLPSGHAALTRTRLLQHEAVIEALMERCTVLPARFGTVGVAGQIAQALELHSQQFAANLARVRGRVEIGLRVLWATPEEAPPPRTRTLDRTDGRAYMQALMAEAQQSRRRHERAEAVAVQLAAGLADLTDEERHEILPDPRPLLKAAYLVRRDYVPEVQRRIVALGAAYPDLALLATGPWPAYSFTDVRQDGAATSTSM
jgi:hypothetical protein